MSQTPDDLAPVSFRLLLNLPCGCPEGKSSLGKPAQQLVPRGGCLPEFLVVRSLGLAWSWLSVLTLVLLRSQQAKETHSEVFPEALGLPGVFLPNKLVVMVCNTEKCWAGCRTGLWRFLLLLRPSGSLMAVLGNAMH